MINVPLMISSSKSIHLKREKIIKIVDGGRLTTTSTFKPKIKIRSSLFNKAYILLLSIFVILL